VCFSFPPPTPYGNPPQSTGNYQYSVGYSLYERAVVLAFRGNSLTLPAGLSYVDDLDTITGNWKA